MASAQEQHRKPSAPSLTVRVNKAGDPVWNATWRDSTGKPVMRTAGPAHLKGRAPRPNPREVKETGTARITAEDRMAELKAAGIKAERWRADWQPKPGKPKAGVLDHRQAQAVALELVAKREAELVALAEPEKTPRTFREVAVDWLAVREGDVADGALKPSSLADYRSMLREPDAPRKRRARRDKGGTDSAWIMRELGSALVANISADSCAKFESQLQAAGRSPRTRTKYMAVVSMILDHARHAGDIERNPLAEAPRKRKLRKQDQGIRFYDIETVERIASQVKDEQIGELVRVLALTGLRVGEALALRWSDVSFTRRSITVKRTYVPGSGENSPKSGSLRTIPLSDQAAVVLDRVSRRDEWTRRGDLVFGRKSGNPRDGREYAWEHVDPATVRRQFGKARDAVIAAAAKAGEEPVESLRVHDLRHSFGTACAAWGVPLVTLQRWLGHAAITTTMIYAHHQPQHDDADRLTAAQGGIVAAVERSEQTAAKG